MREHWDVYLNNPYVCKLPEPLQRSRIQPLSSLKVSIRVSYSSHDFITFLRTPSILKENRSPPLILVGKAPKVVQIPKGVTVFVTPLLSVEKNSCSYFNFFWRGKPEEGVTRRVKQIPAVYLSSLRHPWFPFPDSFLHKKEKKN